MITHYRLLTLSFTLLVVGSAIAFHPTHGNASKGRHDSNNVPIIVTPSPNEITSTGQTTITVTMNQLGSTDTVVSVSSNNTALTVPSSVTVPAGDISAQFTAYGSGGSPRAKSHARAGARDFNIAVVTASANGGQAQGSVEVEN